MLKIEKETESSQAEIADKTETTKFLWIRAPKTLIYNQSFSDAAKLLYLILLDYQGRNPYAFPSLETLASNTGKSVRRVQQLLKELEAAAAIEIISQPGWVNLYRVCQPLTETNPSNTLDQADGTISNETPNADTQLSAPLQDIAPLPMQKISSELDSSQLESKIVCEKSREVQKQSVSGNQIQAGFSVSNSAKAKQTNSQPQLTPDQHEIAELLRTAGVATTDAIRIAATNPVKTDVLQWVEFAKNKANPGGYLAVVLGKLQVAPPQLPTPEKVFSQQANSPHPPNWRKRANQPTSNQQAGAVAFMHRHATELEKWQQIEPTLIASAAQSANAEILSAADYVKLAETALVVTEQATPAESIANFESETTGEAECAVEQTNLSEPAATKATDLERIEPYIDPVVRLLIRQLDRQACAYLRQAQVLGDILLISFVGNYRPTSNVTNWLPTIKSRYNLVNEVRLL